MVVTNSSHGTNVIVTAQPSTITVGGTVQLIAEPPETGTFDAEWEVVGPVQLSRSDTLISQLGTTTIDGGRIEVTDEELLIRATLDTSPLNVGSWRVRIRLIEVVDDSVEGVSHTGEDTPSVFEGESEPIDVLPRPFADGDSVGVQLRRTAVAPTKDQALWVAIRNSTNAIGFDNYSRFLEVVLCGESPELANSRLRSGDTRNKLRKVQRRQALPFTNVERYRLLKAATEVFLMIHSGVDLDDFSGVNLSEESRRLNRTVQPGDLEAEIREYLVAVATGRGDLLKVLPYLGLIRLQLRDVAIVGIDDGDGEAAQVCHGIIAERLTNPCFLELLWSYWHDESGLVQTLAAITWRFQNRTTGSTRARSVGRPEHRSAASAQQPALGLDPGHSASAHHGSESLRVRPRVRSGAVYQAGAARSRRRLPGRGSSSRSTTCSRCPPSSSTATTTPPSSPTGSVCSTR